MASLPSPGSDAGAWGGDLNAWLLTAHNADGSLQASAVQTAYDSAIKIYDGTLGASATSIGPGVGSIPSGFSAIEVLITARSDFPGVAVTTSAVGLVLNGDTGANYFYQDDYGLNATATASNNQGSADNLLRMNVPAATATAGFAATGRYLFHNYDNTTWYKQALLMHGMFDPNVANTGRARLACAFWKNTAAITQIQLVARTNNLVAGTRLTIRGII